MIVWLATVCLVVLGAYALITTGHYANRTPRERSIIGIFVIMVAVLVLDHLGLLNKLWEYAYRTLT